MPVPATRDEFLDLVRKSGVLDEARVDAFARAAAEAGVPLDEPKALAQRMLREGLLTKWQAEQLLKGKFLRFVLGQKYKVLDPIGAGGMGQVFLCSHIYMNRLVALKFLPTDKLKDPSMLERFYREARAAAALDHPNIVRAYDIDREIGETGQNALHYLVMEFVDGASLQEVVARRGPISPERAAHYIKQAARGLEHAHEAGLVHRDIKPGNLLLDRNGTVKVLDLGLARFNEAGKDNVTERFDEKNAILGTADYLAPEQARGDAVDIRADIYSLGATLYFLLSGKAPFEDGTVTQKLLWSQTKPPKPIRELRPDVPEELAAVLDRMMAKDANERYQTPQSVIEALAPWTAMPVPPPPADEMPRRSLAATSPSTQGYVPILPSTPAPRSMPSDMIRSRPGSSPPSRLNGPATPAPRTAPKTPAPAVAPKSRPPGSAVRTPSPRSAVRRRPAPKQSGMSPGMIFAAAAGGAGLLFAGIFVAWLLKRPAHTVETTPSTSAPEVVKEPTQLPPTNKPIPAGQAAKHYNQTVTVDMTVASVGKAANAERFFLNSKQDRAAADNFTVTFTKAVLDQLGLKSVAELDAKYRGRKIRVTGTITKYNEKPQIDVGAASQIKIVGR
jgi:serine/threonine protein kinase